MRTVPIPQWVKRLVDEWLALDDSLPEAHNSLAVIYLFYYRDWARAEEESRRSIQLNPNFAEGHHALSYILFAQNR